MAALRRSWISSPASLKLRRASPRSASARRRDLLFLYGLTGGQKLGASVGHDRLVFRHVLAPGDLAGNELRGVCVGPGVAVGQDRHDRGMDLGRTFKRHPAAGREIVLLK